MDDPTPITELVHAVSERRDSLVDTVGAQRRRQAEAAEARAERKPGKVEPGGYSDAALLVQDSRLHQAERLAVQAAADLELSRPDSLPDDPADLEGSDLSKVLLANEVLGVLDGERDSEGNLPTRQQQKQYAAWAGLRDELEPAVRGGLDALATSLDESTRLTSSIYPDPEQGRDKQPSRSAWR